MKMYKASCVVLAYLRRIRQTRLGLHLALAVKDWPHTAELVRSRVFIAQHGASTAQKEPLTQIRRKMDISTLSLIFYVPGLAGSIGASESF